MRSEIVRITPKMAEQWLGAKNRPLRLGVVQRYKEDILNGNWKLNHQGIAIDTSLNVIDGQHRLKAIIMSGIAVDMYVTFEADPETYDSFDKGAPRTSSDEFALDGLAPRTSKLVSSLIPLITNYEATGIINASHMAKKYGSATPFYKDFLKSNASVIKSAEYGQSLPYRGSLLKQSTACFIHYLISKKYDNAAIYLDRILVGDGVGSGCIEFELRRILIASKVNKSTIIVESVLVKKLINGYNYFNSEKKFTDYRQIVASTNIESIALIK